MTKKKKQRESRTDLLLRLVKRKEGVSVEEIAKTTGANPKTVRAQVSVLLRQRLKLNVVHADGVYKLQRGANELR